MNKLAGRLVCDCEYIFSFFASQNAIYSSPVQTNKYISLYTYLRASSIHISHVLLPYSPLPTILHHLTITDDCMPYEYIIYLFININTYYSV